MLSVTMRANNSQILDARYKLVRPLGQGAMGVVYEGVQLSVDRPVAIKMIREPDLLATKRFRREARMLTSLSHPNIVNVYDFGQTETGALFLVMELLGGKTLATELMLRGRFEPRRVCEIGI